MRRSRNILTGIAAVAAVLAFGLVAWLRPADSGPPPGLDPSQYGWAGPEAVEEARPIVDRLPTFRILDEPGVSRSASAVNVRLWHAADKIGVEIPNVRQQVGDCVSWGYRNAVAYLQCVGIATGSIRGSFHDPFPSYLYGTGRVLIGGGRLSGDGSLGAWQQEAVRRYGVLSSSAPGVPRYSGAVARKWGAPPGPPQQFVDLASDFPVETTALVTSAEDVAAAIENGYPVPICSDFGTRSFRVADGRRIAVGDGSWAHCMCLIAYDETAPSGTRYFYCLNSWGPDAHPPPLGDEPRGGFWLTWSQVDRIAKQRDSFALSNFRGFPARRIDFRILANDSAEEGGNHAQHNRGETVTDGIRRRGFKPAGPGNRLPAVVAGRRAGPADDPGGIARRGPPVIPTAGSERSDATGGDADRIHAAGVIGERSRAVQLAAATGLFHARRERAVADRVDGGAAVSDLLLHPAALPQLQAIRAGDDPRAGQAGLAGRPTADRSFAGVRGANWRTSGGRPSISSALDRLIADAALDPRGAGDRKDRRPEGDTPHQYGWIRPSDLGPDARPLDGLGPVELDERAQARQLFGPSPAELRALADRAVDRTLGQAGQAIEAKAKQLAWTAAGVAAAGCACTGAACGLMIVIAKCIGWCLMRLMRPPTKETS